MDARKLSIILPTNDETKFTSKLSTKYDVSSTVLGKGNYGYVRKCTNRHSGVTYAVKTINKEKVTRLDWIQREVHNMKVLDHPNILKLVDYFDERNHFHIVTEICNGGDLFDLVMDNKTEYGCLPERMCITIMNALLDSVKYLHSRNIVHRDIKLENILIHTKDNKAIVKLIDFGLSRKHGKLDSNMTNRIGTPYYMSPEIINGSYDRACDLWAIGVVCYILLSGYPPFNGYTDSQVHESTMNGTIIFERQVWGKLSKLSRNFVRQLLIKDKLKRISSANEALKHQWVNE